MTAAAFSHPSVMPVPESIEDRLVRFMDLSQELLSLVRHENAILLETGKMSFEAYLMRKVKLMASFEKEARILLSHITGRNTKMNAQAMLIEEIRRVRDALKVNSGYQLDMIRARMQEKSADGEDDALFIDVQKEGSACH